MLTSQNHQAKKNPVIYIIWNGETEAEAIKGCVSQYKSVLVPEILCLPVPRSSSCEDSEKSSIVLKMLFFWDK